MMTVTGRDIRPGGDNAPSLYDIGYALSNTYRFGGHTRARYTVLHHSYAAALLAQALGMSARLQVHALLHDAHEAIIGDIPKPWKTDDMRKLQVELDFRIYTSLSLPLPTLPEYDRIKQIDNMLLVAEARAVGPERCLAAMQAVNEVSNLNLDVPEANRAVADTWFMVKHTAAEDGDAFEDFAHQLMRAL